MKYPVKLFNLELNFAKHISKISNLSFNYCLLNYTDFYKQFRYGTDFNPNNPKWVNFLNQFDGTPEFLYRFSIAERKKYYKNNKSTYKEFGCFSYELINSLEVKIHFSNETNQINGPLALENKEYRKKELKGMFLDIKQNHKHVKVVKGHSWLYNLESYIRLFPSSYTQNKEFKGWEVQYRSYWGQFLNSEQQVKQHLAEPFLKCVYLQKSIDNCLNCVPYKPLAVNGSITDFYEFYKISLAFSSHGHIS